MDSRDDFLTQVAPLRVTDRRLKLGFEDDVIFGVDAFARDARFDAGDLERSGAGPARAEYDSARQNCFKRFPREFGRNEEVEASFAASAVRRYEDTRSRDLPLADLVLPLVNRLAGQGFDQFRRPRPLQ